MKFDLKKLDPRTWPWAQWRAGVKPGLASAQAFLVSNRNAVISTAVALLIGFWGGAVFAQGGAGGRSGSLLPSFNFGSHTEGMRAANAPRAGVPGVDGMAFVRLRAETDSAEPRACLEFSRDLSTDPAIHYSDFLKIDPDAPVQTEVSGNLLCLGGLPLEPERQVTILAGLPAANGEKTKDEETFTLSFGDRPAYVGFSGSGVILPRAEADGVAIETVNVSKLEVEVLRVPERILSQHEVEPGSSQEEGGWGSWDFDNAASDVGVSVYKGTIDIPLNRCPDQPNVRNCSRRNQAVTSVFALGAAVGSLRPGAYVVKVRDASPGGGATNGENPETRASAYRWIINTDMALQSFSGANGLDVVVRSLRTARPMANVSLALIAQNNEELTRVRTDSQGHARFPQSVVRGDGPSQARYVMAYGEGGDFAALDLNRPSLDLSDRGVDGRRPPGSIDAFMYTERGVYRPGERVRLVALVRDQVGRAISDRASTLVVYRPNGTEAQRRRLTEARDAGAIAKNIDIDRRAPRGMWRAELLVDGQDAAAGEVSFSVEDFVPQRLRVKLDADEGVMRPGQNRPINLQADFLYGAPGGGLAVEATGRVSVDPNPFPNEQGFSFGDADESFSERMITLPSTTTDGSGAAQLTLALDDIPTTSLPLRARVVANVADPGGRMVGESFTAPVRMSDLYIGVKPKFENSRAGEGERAAFDVIAVSAEGQRRGVGRVSWRIVREDWNYDWYLDDGHWRWRRTGRDIPVDGGAINVAASGTTLSKDGLRDGSYRLILKDDASGATTTTRFGVGWGGPADDDATPDMVTVVPPHDGVRIGAHARVQIRPPYAGEAQIVVATDRVIDMRTVHVGTDGTTIDLPVTEEWGGGAYVLVTVMTPRDPVNLPVPRRAVGVGYVDVDTASRELQVSVGQGLHNVRPRQRLMVPIQVRNAPAGQRVRVSLAAVDEGILGITKYESPQPVDFFFGRRALGVDVRDDYGRLLNPNLGAPAAARQGWDSLGGEGLTVVPTKTVSLFSDVVTLDASGRANIPLDVPDFNGTLRLMAVAWTETAIGQASEELVVRDPVVAELILPRFLAPGDDALATLNIDNVEGPPGAYRVTVAAQGAANVNAPPRSFNLGRGQRQTAQIPLTGGMLGIGSIRLRLEGPNGFAPVERSYDIQSRAPWMPISIVNTAPQNTGESWRAPADALSRFMSDGRALVSYSNLAGIDPGPLLDELQRYPYGCSEQLTSVAMPLLYYNTLAAQAGVQGDPRLRRRIQETVTQLLDRQTPDGAFGLWSAGDRAASPWLGAYVVDFLTRAKAQGYAVPSQPLNLAYDGLRRLVRQNDSSGIGYAFDVYRWPGSNDSEELLRSRAAAYALYVLAKADRADIAQVRYFHDARLSAEPSPLARAQIAAALARLGDRTRSRHAFQMAEEALGYRNTGDWYQSPVRDLAGVIALAAEAGETALVDRLRRRLEREAPEAGALMTQEQVQLLLAANALLQRAGPVNVALNGQMGAGRNVMADTARLAAGLVFRNDGRGTVWRSLLVTGTPREAPGAMSAGYQIGKNVYRMDGSPADLNNIRQGDRIVVVVNGKPEGARLYPTVVVDLLPAGLEIETVLGPQDGLGAEQYDGTRRSGAFAWIGEISYSDVAEARDDRFVASANLRATPFTFAYIARAVTPGRYAMPGAQVEDMYRAGVMARTASGGIRIAPRGG